MTRRRVVAALFGREEGFTIVESMAAAVILIIAVVLTIAPMSAAMRLIDRSRDVTVAENLAQARIEEIRSLDYEDVGNPGYAPDGILERTTTEVQDGRTYIITTDVQYVGSATGLDVIPQGGDGVEGSFDPGVNYKYVTVTVTPESGSINPVRMDSIVAPPSLGALEDVAVVTVLIDEHEPYDEYADPPPKLQLQGPLNYLSTLSGEQQPFPDVIPGVYDIVLFTPNNWVMHPDTVASGADEVTATAGWNSTRTIRVYQPATLSLTVVDDVGTAIADATVTVQSQASGSNETHPAGDYVFTDLIPDRFTVTASAPGHFGSQIEVDVPGFGGGSSATGTLVLDRRNPPTTTTTSTTTTTIPSSTTTTIPSGTTTTTTTTTTLPPGPVDEVAVTFFIGYFDFSSFADYYINRARVVVDHPVLGQWSGYTDETGKVTLDLPASETGFTATAQTEHGHDPVAIAFDTSTSSIQYDIALGKPVDTDRFAVDGSNAGPDDYFTYRVGRRVCFWFFGCWWDWSQESRLDANDLGNATFILDEQLTQTRRVEINEYCAAGNRVDRIEITLDGENHTWYPNGSCP